MVKTHPSARDQVPGGASHVSELIQLTFTNVVFDSFFPKISWKKKLMNKFMNLHRPARARTSGIALDDTPFPKRAKTSTDSGVSAPPSLSLSFLEEYEHHKKRHKEVYLTKKWILSNLCSLMNDTYGI